MALQTYYTNNNLWAATHYSSSTVNPTTTLLTDVGWIVGSNTPPLFSALDYGTEIARTAITSGTPIPTLNSASAAGNAIFVIGPMTGSFASENWQITQSVKAVTAGGEQDGNFHYRFFKGSNPTGSGATLISAVYATSSGVTNLATTNPQTCMTTYNPGVINLNNEYLFVACQWKLTGAGGGVQRDVNIYVGGPTGSLMITANWTDAPTSSVVVDVFRRGQLGFFFP